MGTGMSVARSTSSTTTDMVKDAPLVWICTSLVDVHAFSHCRI